MSEGNSEISVSLTRFCTCISMRENMEMSPDPKNNWPVNLCRNSETSLKKWISATQNRVQRDISIGGAWRTSTDIHRREMQTMNSLTKVSTFAHPSSPSHPSASQPNPSKSHHSLHQPPKLSNPLKSAQSFHRVHPSNTPSPPKSVEPLD